MKMPTIRSAAILFLFALAGCATMPKGPPPEVARLNNQLAQIRSDQRIAPNAPDEISKAQAAVNALDAQARSLDEKHFQQRVYVADRLVQTAEASGLARFQEQRGKQLGRERDQLLVQAERHRANVARSELDDLRSKLTELQTKETDRGLVITMGDVLFAVNRAEIKPGAMRSLNQLAAALRDDPNARIQIEGHTDSTGGRVLNMELSDRRAESVESYLTSNGVNSDRITARGMGPDYPVASNSTAAGRQQNRRVEIIVNDQKRS